MKAKEPAKRPAKKTRRSWGDGSISGPDAAGWFEVRISRGVDPTTGKRRRTRIRVRSHAQARSELEILRQTIGRRRGHVQKPVTVEDYFTSWIGRVSVALEPKSVRNYETGIENLKPLIGHIKLDQLEADHIAGAMKRIGDRVAKSKHADGGVRTVQVAYDTLRAALNFAVKRDGALPASPMAAVPRPRSHREIDFLTATEARAFLKAVADDRYRALWHLVLATGLRLGEVRALQWSDVDLEGGTITVRRSIKESGGSGRTKTRGSRRRIDLPATVVDELRAHREKGKSSGLVFPTLHGNALTPSNLERRYFFPALERAKLRRIRFHDLRHTFATLALSAGVAPKVVAEILGHSNVRTTLDVYGHVLPTMQREAAKTVDAILFGPEPKLGNPKNAGNLRKPQK